MDHTLNRDSGEGSGRPDQVAQETAQATGDEPRSVEDLRMRQGAVAEARGPIGHTRDGRDFQAQ